MIVILSSVYVRRKYNINTMTQHITTPKLCKMRLKRCFQIRIKKVNIEWGNPGKKEKRNGNGQVAWERVIKLHLISKMKQNKQNSHAQRVQNQALIGGNLWPELQGRRTEDVAILQINWLDYIIILKNNSTQLIHSRQNFREKCIDSNESIALSYS